MCAIDTTVGEPGNFLTQDIDCTAESTVPECADFITPEILSDENDGNNNTIHTNTLPSNAISTTQKTESVEESNTKGKFSEVRKYSRRTALQRKMAVEAFDSASQPIFQQKKSGFLTERPLVWMSAVEQYVDENDDVNARWRYKVDEEEKIYEYNTIQYNRLSSD